MSEVKFLFKNVKGRQYVNSVPTPAAQSPGLCDINTPAMSELEVNYTNFLMYADVAEPVKAVASLLAQEGLRVSEVLNLHSSDVLTGLKVRIKGLKGSGNRIVQPVLYRSFWEGFRKSNYQIGEVYDRFYLYRVFKKYGLYFKPKNSSKYAVTHAFRYDYINKLLK